jgi:membrane protein DedA with SNARE-associated domain
MCWIAVRGADRPKTDSGVFLDTSSEPSGTDASSPVTSLDDVLPEALARWIPRGRKTRLGLGILVLLAVLGPSVVLLFAPGWFNLNESNLQGLGYAGVFVANLASTVTVFIPVPGLTALGQVLILDQGKTLNPPLVGIAGGCGMALGEITAYIAGIYGGQMAAGHTLPGPRWTARLVERAISIIDRLMGRYGMLTLFVLSVIPNPVFEIAGITAGAVRMPFGRFMAPVLVGKVLRGIILAFLGRYSVNVLGL